MTQGSAAKKMGLSLNLVNEVINGKWGVTADTARRFAELTGVRAGVLAEPVEGG